jgi:DNA primase
VEIAEVIEKLNLPFNKANLDSHNELWMPCPLPYGNHKNGDKNPSFSINMETGQCFCFVCGGGNLVFLVSSVLGVSYDDAKKWLGEIEGGYENEDDFRKRMKDKLRLQQMLQSPPEIPQQIFYDTLIPTELAYHPWLEEQKISEETARKFNIFYDPNKNVVVFPHYWEGKIVGMQYRNLGAGKDNKLPRYYNTPDFPRKRTLFNLDFVDSDEVVVVESPKTVCVMDSRGYTNFVATFGASITQEQMSALHKFKRVYLWPDNDKPGLKALESEINFLKDYVDIHIVPCVDVEKGDAADISASLVPEYLANALPYLKWKLRYEKIYQQRINGSP